MTEQLNFLGKAKSMTTAIVIDRDKLIDIANEVAFVASKDAPHIIHQLVFVNAQQENGELVARFYVFGPTTKLLRVESLDATKNNITEPFAFPVGAFQLQQFSKFLPPGDAKLEWRKIDNNVLVYLTSGKTEFKLQLPLFNEKIPRLIGTDVADINITHLLNGFKATRYAVSEKDQRTYMQGVHVYRSSEMTLTFAATKASLFVHYKQEFTPEQLNKIFPHIGQAPDGIVIPLQFIDLALKQKDDLAKLGVGSQRATLDMAVAMKIFSSALIAQPYCVIENVVSLIDSPAFSLTIGFQQFADSIARAKAVCGGFNKIQLKVDQDRNELVVYTHEGGKKQEVRDEIPVGLEKQSDSEISGWYSAEFISDTIKVMKEFIEDDNLQLRFMSRGCILTYGAQQHHVLISAIALD